MDLFAPPKLFSLFAVAAQDDPDLETGSHIRLLPSPILGFPIAPFGLWNIDATVDTNRDHLNLADSDGGERIWIGPPTRPDYWDIGVAVLPERFHARAKVAIVDGTSARVIARRSGFPWHLGAPQPRRLSIVDGGNLEAVNILCASTAKALELILGRPPDELLSLPVGEDRLPWYVGGEEPHPAYRKVASGAPKRLTPLDRPDGSHEDVPVSDEVLRIAVHATETTAGIDHALLRLLGDRTPPWEQRLIDTRDAVGGMPWQKVNIALQNTLMMQAMDPGIARYLGLMTRRDTTAADVPSAWVAVGVFAVDPNRSIGRRKLGDILGPPGQFEDRIIRIFETRIPGLSDLVGEILGGAQEGTCAIRAFIAVGAAVPPADPPDMLQPELGVARWLAAETTPSMAFRQDFRFAGLPLGVVTAMSRLEDQGYVPRQRMIDLGDEARFRERAVPLLIGSQKKLQLVQAGASIPDSLATDVPIPARDKPWLYQFHLSDLFGRFGSGVEIEVPTPRRPNPPTPAVQLEIVRTPPVDGSTTAASPGSVIARAPVPTVDKLSAGSLNITAFEVSVDGVLRDPVPVADGAVDEIALRALVPGETLRTVLTARFRDSAGQVSPDFSEVVEVTDGRRPEVLHTALGIIWTSRPGPAPEVELKLAWQQRQAGESYRAYLADAQGLGIAGATRAAVAKTAGDKQRAGELSGPEFRKRFRLLTDSPLTAGGDGRVLLDERLPRALETVQLLRVIPLTSAGVEADFDDCGVVPVAVPTDRRPPPPRVTAAAAPGAAAATVTIEGPGLDLVELRVAEPGLFADPSTAAEPPEFRLRRAAGTLNDPIYSREIRRGPLVRHGQGDQLVFRADVTDPTTGALTPFVRYTYWAEVRMPPERRILGPAEAPIPGGIAALDPAQAMDCPRPFSQLSAPASVIAYPAELPALADDGSIAVSIERGTGVQRVIRLHIARTPSIHPLAVGPYLLRIWQQWGAEDITAIPEPLPLNSGSLQWDSLPNPAPSASATLRLVLVDPLGREGPMLMRRSA
jgi:hypothetical protein